MLKRLMKSLANLFMGTPVTEDSLRENYRQMPDAELMRISPGDLTLVARKLWRDEVSRRKII